MAATRIRDLEKPHNTLDVFEYLCLRFIAFGYLQRQPPLVS